MAHHTTLMGRASALAGDVLGMLQTRLEMLSVELQRERDAVVLQLKLGMISVVAAGVAGLSAVLWAALSLEPYPRAIALGTLTVIFFTIAVVATLAAQRAHRRQQRMFESVIAQLGRDRSTLGSPSIDTAQEKSHEYAGNPRQDS